MQDIKETANIMETDRTNLTRKETGLESQKDIKTIVREILVKFSEGKMFRRMPVKRAS